MFLIIQNDPKCPAGSCPELLAAAGHDFKTVLAYHDEPFPPASSATGIIVLGGVMGAHDTERYPYLLGVRRFLAAALEAGTPLLGICLGGQLLADVAGGKVSSPSRHGEKGICRVDLCDTGDPLFAGVPRTFVTFQLHNDSFSPPPGATLLATSPACPAQAFRLAQKAYGVQFHPEVDRKIVSSWAALSTPPVDFLSPFIAEERAFRSASQVILANFISVAAGA